MAQIPYFVIGPNTILSIVGLIRGPDKTVPTPADDWRKATVDVVIPALNEEHTIALCLASLARQTIRPQRIILIDDGGSDRTTEFAQAFCRSNDMDLIAIRRKAPIGKTPTIKRQSREFDSDVEFVLDGDTILESDNYLERAVQELYQGVGIASACGTILPMRKKDRARLLETEPVQNFLRVVPNAPIYPPNGVVRTVSRGITNAYRDALYLFLQRFVYRGQMVFFGTITNPVGCAVAYRRKYVKDMFDTFEPKLGDDLTTSEDIFIGFAMANQGYRNIQLTDVYARSMEPEAHRLPRQIFLWSSSFLQSCYYFNGLLLSPLKAPRRWLHQRRTQKKFGKEIAEKRKVKEQYRQPFGAEYTRKFGRNIGWVMFASAFEKISFPVVLLIMIIFRLWEALLLTIAAESVLALSILLIGAKGHRAEYFLKGLVATPVRYLGIFSDLFTIGRFAVDVWVLKNRRWRK